MNVFIQRPEDGLFLDGLSDWGPKEVAYNFERVGVAAEFCLARPLHGVRILVEFDRNPTRNVALEVTRVVVQHEMKAQSAGRHSAHPSEFNQRELDQGLIP